MAACAVLMALAGMMALGAAAHAKDRLAVAGYLEYAKITPGSMTVAAKLDSGAQTSSIDAHDIEQFVKDGSDWVRFTVKGRQDNTISMERPLKRMVTIRRFFGTKQRRPVVELGICLGKVYRVTEVNLVDRTGLNYALLIGRRFLQKAAVIDSGKTFILPPNCAEMPAP